MPSLVISVRFFGGRYHGLDTEGRPEWPPSPGRLFQALVASAAKGAILREEDRNAFAWLERLKAPSSQRLRCERAIASVTSCQTTISMLSMAIPAGLARFGRQPRGFIHVSLIGRHVSSTFGPSITERSMPNGCAASLISSTNWAVVSIWHGRLLKSSIQLS